MKWTWGWLNREIQGQPRPQGSFQPHLQSREKLPGDEVDSRPFSYLQSESWKWNPVKYWLANIDKLSNSQV